MGRKILKGSYQAVSEPELNKKYHVSWAKKGCVWKCVAIDRTNQTVTLETPKTKKLLTAKWADLLHIRKNQTLNTPNGTDTGN